MNTMTLRQAEILLALPAPQLASIITSETMLAALGDSEEWLAAQAAGTGVPPPAFLYSFLKPDGSMFVSPSPGPDNATLTAATALGWLLLAEYALDHDSTPAVHVEAATGHRRALLPRYRYTFRFFPGEHEPPVILQNTDRD